MRLRVFLLLLCVLMAAACGGTGTAADRGGPEPTDPPAAMPGDEGPTDDAAGGAAGGTAPRAVPLETALTAEPAGPTLITGLLIDDGSGWRLCSMVAESYPPQCAGESVTVEGVEASDHNLQEAQGVRWQEDATVYGELSGGVITVTGPASAA